MKQYTDLIDGILMNADLETVTRKKIRQSLERSLGGKDLSAQKVSAAEIRYGFPRRPQRARG